MSHRTNWKTLRLSDPIPGDVAGIRDAAEHYRKINQALTTARQSLEVIITGKLTNGMISQSVDAIRDKATTVKNNLAAISGRYSVVANELHTYADALDRAQTQADEAEGDAQNAQTAIDSAQLRITVIGPKLDILRQSQPTDPDEVLKKTTDLTKNNRLLSDAQADKAQAMARKNDAAEKLNRAIRDRDNAAAAAATAIRRQINSDGQNDTFWDTWSSKAASIIESIIRQHITALNAASPGLISLVASLLDFVRTAFGQFAGTISSKEYNDRFKKAGIIVLTKVSSISGIIASNCNDLSLALMFAPVPGARVASLALGIAGGAVSLTQVLAEGWMAVAEGSGSVHWDRMKEAAIEAALGTIGIKVARVSVGWLGGQISNSATEMLKKTKPDILFKKPSETSLDSEKVSAAKVEYSQPCIQCVVSGFQLAA